MTKHSITPDLSPYMKKSVYDPDDDGVIAVAQTEADMKKADYDPNEDGKIALSSIDIDADLAMGAHNITLDSGYKVDGIDVSEHTHSVSTTKLSMNPTLYNPTNITDDDWHILAELTHDFNTTHVMISYKVTITDKGGHTNAAYVGLFINGVKEAVHYCHAEANQTHQSEYCDVLEVSEGSDISVQVKIYRPSAVKYDAEGKELVVQSFDMAKPS